MKFAFCLNTADKDIKRVIKEVIGLGYAAIELGIKEPKNEIKEIKNLLIKNNIKVVALQTGRCYIENGLSLTDDNPTIRLTTINRLKEYIELANELNSLVIIGLIRGKGKNKKYLIDGITQCLDYATKKAVKLVIEPLNRYETSLINSMNEGLKFISNFHDLYLLLDTFHMNIEEKSLEQAIKKAKDYLLHIHFADSNRLYLGAGHIEFIKILNILNEINYNGFISMEVLPKPTPYIAAKKCIEYLSSLNY